MARYLINDAEIGTEIKKTLVLEFDVIILEAEAMTTDVLAWQNWENLTPEKTVLVMPGNGAEIVKTYIAKMNPAWFSQWPWQFRPFAKRIWQPGENPQIFTERIDPDKMHLGIKHVIVLDDVISSGSTIQRLKQINEPWIPGATWRAITWVKQEAAMTKGFYPVIASKSIGERNHKVPINSLSTLMERPEIANSYAQRNFGTNASYFLEIINS
ncbi:MAG: phosphoribosyltransferase [Candidatus Falkowbacteria bacterium]